MGVIISTHTTALDVAEDSAWFKSSYSNDTGGACLEVAILSHRVGIRDSKNLQGPALVVPSAVWLSFVGLVRMDPRAYVSTSR
ncbi:DUF397 domain-containing protein [Streptomyces albipurpureus]|uniref:DUF397 domain-containing protein n=1 Tax=Streptomyces albipurpureus TaxID=2897419 RepID=A0ABT0UQ61_9ACTN|nr:DUF397 domain-containing protein [Streptomyces sp. CWNU-1]MCM2390129.1 DUF397 domain-containing protein [Streptomyces sp. CWNU-1]